jgi:hypothetical protein
MPYILKKSNGLTLTTVADGSIDTTTTPLTFVGKNYAGYGQILDQNLVYLLENFANTIQPTKPMAGQLWFDTANKLLKVYNGTQFKPLQNFATQATQPLTSNKGDLWFDDSTQKLYVYNGNTYALIGPQQSQFSGVALDAATVTDQENLSYSVLKFSITDPNTGYASVPAIVSSNEIATNSGDALYPYFNTIRSGITLAGADPINGVSYPGDVLWGTAANALGLYSNSLGYHQADDFLLASTYYSDLSTGLYVNSLNGLTVDTSGVIFKFHSNGVSEGKITAINGTSISFNLHNTLAGTYTNAVTINQNNIVPNSSWGINLGTTASYFSNAFINSIRTSAMTATTVVAGFVTATTVVSSVLKADPASAYGQIQGNWRLQVGSTLQATYADLAERYAADDEYDFGTVLVVGGDAEVTTTTKRADIRVAGVVSQNPAYMMNSGAGDNKTHPYIALKGRVFCRVTGIIHKGDLLVTSTMSGHAELYREGDPSCAVIGKALEYFSGHSGIVEIKV